MAFSFDLAGGVEVGHFQSAFQALLDRSDALRTTFRVSGGIPEQVVLPSLTFELPFHDWSSREVSETDLQKWLALQSQKKIDLGERSFDSALLKLSENRFIWFLNQHHLLTDAWAVGVLFRAMAGLYDRARKGSLDEAPELPSFRDYAEQVNDAHPDQKKEERIQ